MFDYDRRPLDARIEAEGGRERLRWQKVSFTAAYGGRANVGVSWYTSEKRSSAVRTGDLLARPNTEIIRTAFLNTVLFESLTAFIPQSGRVLVMPVFKGSVERDGARLTGREMSPDTTLLYRDLAVQWVKDMRRTIDYLETRSDIKTADGVGFYGVSWGGQIAPLPLAMEPRIKAAVLNTGGYQLARSTQPEVDAGNYTPRVHAPILMLSGAHDNAIFPYETSQAPFFQQLGTAAADKKRVAYTASHLLPQEEVIRENACMV
jgi:hypothetical protein